MVKPLSERMTVALTDPHVQQLKETILPWRNEVAQLEADLAEAKAQAQRAFEVLENTPEHDFDNKWSKGANNSDIDDNIQEAHDILDALLEGKDVE